MSEVATLVGEVSGYDALILDDMIDTAGTLVGAAKALAERGAKTITAVATHGVLSGPAIERLAGSVIDEVIITDTLDLTPEKRIEKIKVLSVSSLLAEAIFRIHRGESVSSLFV